MKITRDIVLVSAVLFTIALVSFVPGSIGLASTWHQRRFQWTSTFGENNFLAPLGFASLSNIIIGLLVLWTGYIKRKRWSWLIMLTIVVVWAFPVLLMPVLQDWHMGIASLSPVSSWVVAAWHEQGSARSYLEYVFGFVVLVVALLLPVRSFFGKSTTTTG